MSKEDTFPDFSYTRNDIEKYISAAGRFTRMLKNGSIIHFEPKDVKAFETWLDNHNVHDIKSE